MPTFTEVPAVNRSPRAFTEIDDSQSGAGGSSLPHAVILGRMTSAGSATENELNVVTSPSQADELFGARSRCAAMCRAFFARTQAAQVTAIGLDNTGTEAAGDLIFAGPATADGTVELRIGGRTITAAVASGDAATAIADAVRTALAADERLEVVGSGATSTIDIDAACVGAEGDDILLEVISLPAGVSCTPTQLSSGAGSLSYATAIGNLAEETYDAFIVEGTETTPLNAIVAEVTSRWNALRGIDGHVYAAHRAGTVSAAITHGDTRDGREETIIDCVDSPNPPWQWAATVAGAALASSDTAAPLIGSALPGLIAGPIGAAITHAERNLLLEAGVSTFGVNAAGAVTVDRLVTTYKTDDFGSPSNTWRALSTRRTVSYLRRDWTARIQSKYLDHKLADDGTAFAPGAKVVTPSVIRGEALAWYREQEFAGRVENAAAFKAGLDVARDNADLERINALITPDIINECVTIATALQFRG
jgi:phage tail sheath gpL-like